MEYRLLGKTGLNVSKLCFGTLTMGSLQADLPPEEGAALLHEAYNRGINFWDTAELYGNYKTLRLAIRKIKELPVITTKTYAYTRKDASASLEKARFEMDIDVIPIFLLHEQESSLTLQGHKEALDFFCEAKSRGMISALGISCHTVSAVRAALNFPEIDVIHPIVNFKGIGIKDGTLEEMLEAIGNAYRSGLGIYGMKALGGGHLIPDAEKAIRFVRSLENLHSFALGISSYEELETDLHYFYGEKPADSLLKKVAARKRQLKIEDQCTGCGSCVQNCPQEALFLEGSPEKRAVVDHLRCILCGYCGAYCPEFCLKIF
ncbi:MAG: aldo/keto reductase [Bacillota bacterium]|nr:aldo/keto reductase [Bacillota bacterium]